MSTTTIPKTALRSIEADGIKFFYREAGPVDGPVVLLLHGYPTSSFMFRELMPRLAFKYRVIAPDMPSFGFSEVPAERHYHYSFDNLAHSVNAFVEALNLTKYAIYIFDYGAPTGLRLAMAHPERVTAIISQNGNAYEEGLGGAWDPIRKYWKDPTPENRNTVREFLSFDGNRFQYVEGTNPALVAPETYWLDTILLQRPGNIEVQLDLFLDYANNVKLYPKFHEYFRQHLPPLLAIWGKHDPFFIPPGAEAYKRDLPNAKVVFLDTGHFALETHVEEINQEIQAFLAAKAG